MKTRKECADKFNSMPFEHRIISVDIEMIARIQDLELLKERVKANYTREIQYINARIKNYESTLK